MAFNPSTPIGSNLRGLIDTLLSAAPNSVNSEAMQLELITQLAQLAVVEQITYANLKSLHDTGRLTPNKYYEITDFRSVMLVPGQVFTNISVRGNDIPEHSLVVQAASTTKLNPFAVDMEFPTDVVKYDITGGAGGAAYPTDGTGKGYIYFREWLDVTPAKKGTTSHTIGFDGRNAVVTLYAVDISAMNAGTIRHCSIGTSGWLYFDADVANNVNVTPLDTTPYDAITNTDGVKYLFMFLDARSWNTNLFFNNKINNTGNSFSIPKLFVHPNLNEFINNDIKRITGELFIGEEAALSHGLVNEIEALRILNTPQTLTYVLGHTGNWWAANATMQGLISSFKGFVLDAKIGWNNSGYYTPGLSGVFTNKAAVSTSEATTPKLTYMVASDVYIDSTAWADAWSGIAISNSRVKLTGGVFVGPNSFGSLISNFVSNAWNVYNEIVSGIQHFTVNANANNMKKQINLTTTPISSNVLPAQNQWAGVLELVAGVGTNSIKSITGSSCSILIIKNSSGYDLSVTTGGTIVFPAHITAPQTVPNGGYIRFTKTDTGAYMVG